MKEGTRGSRRKRHGFSWLVIVLALLLRTPASMAASSESPVLFVTSAETVIGFEADAGGVTAAWVTDLRERSDAGNLVDFGLDGDWGYALYETGHVVNLGAGPEPRRISLDLGRAIALSVDSKRGEVLMLDDTGRLHSIVGTKPDWLPGEASVVSEPVDMLIRDDGGWILDAFGRVVALGDAPKLRTNPSAKPDAREIRDLGEGRIAMLDAAGLVTKLSATDPPWVLLQSRPREDATPVSLTTDPETLEAVVLWSDGNMTPPSFPSLAAVGKPLLRAESVKAGQPIPPKFHRESVRLAFAPSLKQVDLAADPVLLPIRIHHALDMAWLTFTVKWDPDYWVAGGTPYWWESLPAAADVYAESGTGSVRYEIDCRAAPGSETLNGSGTLLYLPLRPLMAGNTEVSIEDFRWSCRTCRSRSESDKASKVDVEIVRSPPSASLAVVSSEDLEATGSREDPLVLAPGRPLTIDVVVSGARNLAGFCFNFTFDEGPLQLVSCRPGEWMAREGTLVTRLGEVSEMNSRGASSDMLITLLGETRGVRGSGGVARMEFFPKAPGRGFVRLGKMSAITSDGQSVDLPVRAGEIWTEVR